MRTLFRAVPSACALVILFLPTFARGQVAIDPNIAYWYKSHGYGNPLSSLAGARVGYEGDGTLWRTLLWHINVGAPDGAAASIMALDPVTGKGFPEASTSPAQDIQIPSAAVWANLAHGAEWDGGIPYHGAWRTVVYGSTPTSPAQDFNSALWMKLSGGDVISEIVQRTDYAGNVISAYSLTDPNVLGPGLAETFSVGLAVESGWDTLITINNPSESSAHIKFGAYDGHMNGDKTPFAMTNINLPPGGAIYRKPIAGIFSATPEYQSFVSQGSCTADGAETCPMGTMPQGLLSIESDQPISVAVTVTYTRSDGTTLFAPWAAFPVTQLQPSAPTPATLTINKTTAANFSLGESWLLSASSPLPSAAVYICGTFNGRWFGCPQIGQTDVSGNFNLAGKFDESVVGVWREILKVVSSDGTTTYSNPIDFIVSLSAILQSLGDDAPPPPLTINGLTDGDFQVGDQWAIVLEWMDPNAGMSICATYHGLPAACSPIGETDTNGKLKLSGVFPESVAGSWEEWFVGADGRPTNRIRFTVRK